MTEHRSTSDGTWHLRVVDGPDTGLQAPLFSGGAVYIGRTSGCALRLSDMEVSRRHASVRLEADESLTIQDLDSTNGTWVDGVRLDGPRILEPGAQFEIGLNTIVLEHRGGEQPKAGSTAAGASTRPDGEGGLLLNRVPSLRQPFTVPGVTLPLPPRRRDKRPLPWIPALIPLVFAGGVYLVTGTTSFLLFALLSPLTLGANIYSNRRSDKRQGANELADYQDQLSAAQGNLAAAIQAEQEWYLASAISGDQAAQVAIARTARLWERSPGDADFLTVRVGLGDRPATVAVSAPSNSTPPAASLTNVPLVARLAVAGVTSVVGPRHVRSALTRSIVIQIAALHAADEVRIALLSEQPSESEWEYLRWLPHTWHSTEQRNDISYTAADIDGEVARLLAIVTERAAARRNASEEVPSPAWLVLLEDGASLRRRPDIAQLLAEGPRQGVYAVSLDEESGLAPEERRLLVEIDVRGQVRVENMVSGIVWRGSVDTLGSAAAVDAAIRLAPIRRVGRQQGNAGLPNRLTLFEMLGTRPTVETVLDRWNQARLSRGPVPVGRAAAGTFFLDLVRSGPHALVGGTSGSGKSEFIQTWVTSMALHTPPDELTFLFVEYKGLSAFRQLQHLPHCVGTITNLSPGMTARALTSLGAELRRRQTEFVKAEVGDIAAYASNDARIPISQSCHVW